MLIKVKIEDFSIILPGFSASIQENTLKSRTNYFMSMFKRLFSCNPHQMHDPKYSTLNFTHVLKVTLSEYCYCFLGIFNDGKWSPHFPSVVGTIKHSHYCIKCILYQIHSGIFHQDTMDIEININGKQIAI